MMRQEIVEDVITKLQRSGLPIDVNVLATLLDVSSTRETNIRPIHRSTTSSNNQGQNHPPFYFLLLLLLQFSVWFIFIYGLLC